MPKYNVFELVVHLRKCPDIFLNPSLFTRRDGLDSVALMYDAYRLISNDFQQTPVYRLSMTTNGGQFTSRYGFSRIRIFEMRLFMRSNYIIFGLKSCIRLHNM
jgi:hypothetical protein